MSVQVGIGLAFVAMLCWGFGDFLIQRSTRKIGDWETLFFISAFGSIVLFPFVYRDLPAVFSQVNSSTAILVGGSVILFFAALLDFEALKKGKLAVVEPIWSFEVPTSAVLAYIVLGERLEWQQTILIALLLIGLVFVSFKKKYFSKRYFLEKGVAIAFFAAFLMGAANFFVGWSARVVNPLLAIFLLHSIIAIETALYLIFSGKTVRTERDMARNGGLLLVMSISDNAAWVAFAFAMSLAPIGIAVALSESYIVVAVMLGLLVNKEKLQIHQRLGLILAIFAVIVLASITAYK